MNRIVFLFLILIIVLIPTFPACSQRGAALGQNQTQDSLSAKPLDKSAVYTLAFMGDIMLGTENLLPPDGAKGFFTDVIPFLKDREIVFGNLEGPLTDRGSPTKDTSTGRSFCFRTPPSYGQILKDAGFNIMSLANNHAYDYGEAGRAQTVETLDALGIAHTGGPGEIAYMDVLGRSFAFIALAPNRGCQSINDIDGAVALVEKALAKDPKTLVIVSMHGGAEGASHMVLPNGPETFMGENRGDLRRLSHTLIDHGAAMVIGHGPHVPRGAELYKDRLIAYSLGNFATASGINVKGASGLAPLLLAEMDAEGKTISYKIVSFRQEMNKGPKLDPTDEAAKVIADLSKKL
ncbi:MAG: CapA family protein [Deltaproteobacteria bacterium]|jgi:poly-gamma-glutamate capsule biosynthesis protein CapA/YwtB (metallophosphatase superfamily)|nr:CapA family protein [Deltaproteobacteria bacterium]